MTRPCTHITDIYVVSTWLLVGSPVRGTWLFYTYRLHGGCIAEVHMQLGDFEPWEMIGSHGNENIQL